MPTATGSADTRAPGWRRSRPPMSSPSTSGSTRRRRQEQRSEHQRAAKASHLSCCRSMPRERRKRRRPDGQRRDHRQDEHELSERGDVPPGLRRRRHARVVDGPGPPCPGRDRRGRGQDRDGERAVQHQRERRQRRDGSWPSGKSSSRIARPPTSAIQMSMNQSSSRTRHRRRDRARQRVAAYDRAPSANVSADRQEQPADRVLRAPEATSAPTNAKGRGPADQERPRLVTLLRAPENAIGGDGHDERTARQTPTRGAARLIAGPQPQRDVGRLHRLRHDAAQVGAEVSRST